MCCKTVIGYGAPNAAGTHESHGAALGATEVAATRAALGWSYPPFEVPADIRAAWDAHEAGANPCFDQLLLDCGTCGAVECVDRIRAGIAEFSGDAPPTARKSPWVRSRPRAWSRGSQVPK